MKITYFSKYSNKGPSSRYRIFQFQDCFEKSGVDLQILPLFDDGYFGYLRHPDGGNFAKSLYVGRRFARRLSQVWSTEPDLFVIEHQLFPYLPFGLENLVLPSKFLLEFDDAIYLTHPRKFPKMLRRATAVIVGNESLAEYARNYASQVHIIPTVLDIRRYQQISVSGESKRIRIGWAGLEYNYRYLKILEPVYQKISEKYPVEFVVLSGSPPGGFQFPFRFVEWDGEKEEELLSQFDIGVMPLKMDEWCRGKCGLKLLQYMALGIASVATPAGVNSQIVQHGVNGFTASTLEEWETCLVQLVTNSALRSQLGCAARETVVQRYSVDVWYPEILDLYKKYL